MIGFWRPSWWAVVALCAAGTATTALRATPLDSALLDSTLLEEDSFDTRYSVVGKATATQLASDKAVRV